MIKITDSDMFPLKGTKERFIHICTVDYTSGLKLRTFMYFHDRLTNKRYCEEITGGHLEFIEEDEIVLELDQFFLEKGYAQIIISPLYAGILDARTQKN